MGPGAPAPAGGGLIDREWFKTYGSDDRPDSFDQIVQSWDAANKVGELNAYSVCTTWGIKGSRIYLLHVLRRRMEYPDLKRAVVSQARIYGATVVLIEDQASGTFARLDDNRYIEHPAPSSCSSILGEYSLPALVREVL